MPSLFSRLKPGPGRCPRGLCGRRPLRRLLPPPPPEGFPGPAFIVLSTQFAWIAKFCRISSFIKTAFPASADIAGRLHTLSHLRSCGYASGYTLEQTPTLKRTAICERKNLLFKCFDFSVYRIRKAPPQNGWRERPARERGLMGTVLCYSPLRKSARACSMPVLHRRPCTMGCGNCLPASEARVATISCRVKADAPTPATASRNRPHLRNSDEVPQSKRPLPPTLRSRAPA